MNTSIIKFDYNGNIIPFEKGSDVMVNLTACLLYTSPSPRDTR